jgi:hypothetical protein
MSLFFHENFNIKTHNRYTTGKVYSCHTSPLAPVCYIRYDSYWLLDHSITTQKTQGVPIFYVWSPLWMYTTFIVIWPAFLPSSGFHNRIIKLNQLIWPHILNQNQPFGEVDDSAFIDAFCSQPQWINYKPKPFRLSLIQRSLPSSAVSPIQTSKWSLFWKMPVSLKADLYGIVYSTVNSIANHFFQDLIMVWSLHNVNFALLILKTYSTSSCAVPGNGEYG